MKGTRPGVSGAQHPVTATRDSLPPDQRDAFGAAVKGAAGVLALHRAECEQAVREGGPEAVGRAVAGPGDSPREIAEHYARLQKQMARELAPTGT